MPKWHNLHKLHGWEAACNHKNHCGGKSEGKGIKTILGYQFSFTNAGYSTAWWMPRVLIAVLSNQWYPRVRQATVASGNLLQPLTADAGSPNHRNSRFRDWLYQVRVWIGYRGTRSPMLPLRLVAPGWNSFLEVHAEQQRNAWSGITTRLFFYSCRGPEDCPGKNYWRNWRESGGRLVESNSTFGEVLRNRGFGAVAISPTLHWCEISCCGFSIFPGSMWDGSSHLACWEVNSGF